MTNRVKKEDQLVSRLIRWTTALLVLVLMTIILSDAWIENNAKGRLYTDVEAIPKQKVGLILGTSKWSKRGENLFYSNRVKAAVALYNAGKVDYLLISGDNATTKYNEPKMIREDLLKNAVPDNRIVLDYAGFRTLDSVVRSKEVFGQTEVTIISQQFHIERALFIADNKDLGAIGFNARNVGGEGGMMVKIRERLARVKMMLDLLTGKEPKFLGESITIGA